jgi:hypothetical protein
MVSWRVRRLEFLHFEDLSDLEVSDLRTVTCSPESGPNLFLIFS